jgi:ABC-2 type transport system ATP-binding protein
VLTEVEKICDRVGILQAGKLVHLQSMAELRRGRLFRIRFARPPEALPAWPDLTVRHRHDDQLTLELMGPLPAMLEWLARQSIADLQVEPVGLSAVYHRYHGAEA